MNEVWIDRWIGDEEYYAVTAWGMCLLSKETEALWRRDEQAAKRHIEQVCRETWGRGEDLPQFV